MPGLSRVPAQLQRPRPTYKAPPKVVCMLGERYSFPSGHALRAAYAAVVFSGPHGPNFGLWPRGASDKIHTKTALLRALVEAC